MTDSPIPLDKDGLPDIRVMGSRKKPGRHNISMSAQAATDYLELKLQLLEQDSLIDLSDSAMIELLVFCATHGLKANRVVFSDWRPLTKDVRKNPGTPVKDRSTASVRTSCERIFRSISERKETTRERLEFFRAYPEAAAQRKRMLCRRARVKDLEALRGDVSGDVPRDGDAV